MKITYADKSETNGDMNQEIIETCSLEMGEKIVAVSVARDTTHNYPNYIRIKTNKKVCGTMKSEKFSTYTGSELLYVSGMVGWHFNALEFTFIC